MRSHAADVSFFATASDYQQACSVAEPFGLFDTVLGSDGQRNLKGREKLKTIVDSCGAEFDYVGIRVQIWRSGGAAGKRFW